MFPVLKKAGHERAELGSLVIACAGLAVVAVELAVFGDGLLEDDGFTTGYAHSASTFEDATRLLVGLLRAADSPQAD